MGWQNPDISWGELERRLSGRPREMRTGGPTAATVRRSAASGRGTSPTGVPSRPRAGGAVRRTALPHQLQLPRRRGHPEQLVAEATRLGLSRLASPTTTASTGRADGRGRPEVSTLSTVFGAELSLGLTTPQNGVPDPEGDHLLVLARGVEGYHRLAGAITEAQLRGAEKGRPLYDLDELAAAGAATGGADRLPQGRGAPGAGRRGRRPRRGHSTGSPLFGHDVVGSS